MQKYTKMIGIALSFDEKAYLSELNIVRDMGLNILNFSILNFRVSIFLLISFMELTISYCSRACPSH